MALAIDSSSPVVATQTSGTTATVVTASFTPPAGALLLIGWAGNTGTASDPGAPAITDSLGGHLTYTQIGWKHRTVSPTVDGQAAMWWAVVGSSAAMTVTVTTGTGSGARQGGLKVWVITGADTTTPIGASGATGSSSAASIAQNYTASATSGWGFLTVCDWDLKGAETAGTGCTVDGSANILTDITYAFARRTTADDSSGVTNTLRTTLPGSSTNLAWVYAEVLPAAGGGSTVNGTASITGAGALSATATQNATAAPAGVGALAVSVVQQASATPAGAGALTASVVQQASASPVGAGVLSAAATQGATAAPTGVGTLSALAVQQATASLVGAGALTATGASSGGATASLTGAGTLTVTATQRSSAALTGSGAVTVAATQNGKASPAGAGALTAAGVIAGAAAIVGAGALTSPVRQLAGAGLAASGLLSASAGGAVSGTASLVGAGVLVIDLNPCTTLRPFSGTTAHLVTVTPRPDTGITEAPC